MTDGAESYRRFLAGEEEGLAEIVRDYKDGLILYLNGYTHDLDAAEDLMEDTFVKLVVKRPRFTSSAGFKTWLYTIARNRAVDYLRHNRAAAMLPEQAAQAADLEQSYLRQERKIALHRAMDRLNVTYRQVLYLAYFEDFSNEQIGAVLKKTRRQVENLLYRATQALRAECSKEGVSDEGL